MGQETHYSGTPEEEEDSYDPHQIIVESFITVLRVKITLSIMWFWFTKEFLGNQFIILITIFIKFKNNICKRINTKMTYTF